VLTLDVVIAYVQFYEPFFHGNIELFLNRIFLVSVFGIAKFYCL